MVFGAEEQIINFLYVEILTHFLAEYKVMGDSTVLCLPHEYLLANFGRKSALVDI